MEGACDPGGHPAGVRSEVATPRGEQHTFEQKHLVFLLLSSDFSDGSLCFMYALSYMSFSGRPFPRLLNFADQSFFLSEDSECLHFSFFYLLLCTVSLPNEEASTGCGIPSSLTWLCACPSGPFLLSFTLVLRARLAPLPRPILGAFHTLILSQARRLEICNIVPGDCAASARSQHHCTWRLRRLRCYLLEVGHQKS